MFSVGPAPPNVQEREHNWAKGAEGDGEIEIFLGYIFFCSSLSMRVPEGNRKNEELHFIKVVFHSVVE